MKTKAKVLLVEDEALTRKLLSAWLIKMGIGVVQAEDGAQALKLLDREAPDLILLDLKMQPMDGFNFLKRFNLEAPNAPPVVAITGDNSTDLLTRLQDFGVTATLRKPLAEERFSALINRFLKDKL